MDFFRFLSKTIINWIKIENFTLSNKNIIIEMFFVAISVWGFYNLELLTAIPFTIFTINLIAISYVDFKTFQIPLIFILICVMCSIANIFFKNINLTAAFFGIFIVIIPLGILGLMMINKKTGMGFGDIQLVLL